MQIQSMRLSYLQFHQQVLHSVRKRRVKEIHPWWLQSSPLSSLQTQVEWVYVVLWTQGLKNKQTVKRLCAFWQSTMFRERVQLHNIATVSEDASMLSTTKSTAIVSIGNTNYVMHTYIHTYLGTCRSWYCRGRLLVQRTLCHPCSTVQLSPPQRSQGKLQRVTDIKFHLWSTVFALLVQVL